jgi:hypothetical protein
MTPTAHWRLITVTYTIEEITTQTQLNRVAAFICESSELISEKYNTTWTWERFLFEYNHRLTVCFRDGEPVGFMLARLSESTFDHSTKLLIQELLYAKPGTRAVKLLMDDFIDFGRRRANHIITMIAEHTNIKARSLEKLGFKKLETLYRIEV